MNSRAVTTFALLAAVLVVVAPIAYTDKAAALSKNYSDGPAFSSEWSSSTYSGDLEDTNLNGTTKAAKLKQVSGGDDEGDFNGYDSRDSDLGTTSSEAFLKNGPSKGTAKMTDVQSMNRQPPASAERGGYVYFMGDDIRRYWYDSGAGSVVEKNMCDAAGNTNGEPRGLAHGGGFSGDELTIMVKDTVDAVGRIYTVNTDFCNFDEVESWSTSDGLRGMAPAPDTASSSDRYYMSGTNNRIGLVELGSKSDSFDGSRTVNILDIPDGHQRGLDVKEFPDGTVWFFIGYTTGGNQDNTVLVVRKSDGAVIDEYTPSSNSVNPVWNHQVTNNGEYKNKIWTNDQSANSLYETVAVNQWSGDGTGNVKYSHSFTSESGINSHDLTEVSAIVDVPSTFKETSGNVKIQVKDGNNNWQTVGSYDEGAGGGASISCSESCLDNRGAFDSGIDDFEYRFRVSDEYVLKGGDGFAPALTSISWKWKNYKTGGVVESTQLSTRDVKSFDTLELHGSSGGNGIDVEVLDKNGNIEYSNTGVQPDATLDISSISVDSSTEYVTVRNTLTTSGGSTPTLSGWEMTYEGNPSAKVISYNATVSKDDVTLENDSTVQSEIGSEDEFVVEEVNQTVEDVTWKVNNNVLKTETVDSQGPFSFNYTWNNDETGVNTVTAEMENRNGTVSQTWEVDIPQPSTVKVGTVDIIQSETQVGTGEVTENVTVDFPGDSQTITSDLGTQYQIAIDTSNENVTYDVNMSVSDPVGTNTSFTWLTGDNVTSGAASLPYDKTGNFDGQYQLTVEVTITNDEFSTFDVHAIFKQQIGDAQSTPVVASEKIPSAAHRGQPVNVSATVSSEITSIKQAWLRVENPNGTVDRRAIAPGQDSFYGQAGNDTVSYAEQVTFNQTGTYEVTFVGQNYDGLNGTSRTYVIDVSNSPPQGTLLDPPTQVNANRSFRLFWDVSDPEGDPVTETGIILISPSGEKLTFTDDAAGAGEHSMTIGEGNVTQPGLWAIRTYQQDDQGGLSKSSRVVVDVVSLQEYEIANVSVARWDGQQTSTLDAGRDVQVEAEITPDVSSTQNGTVYVNLETQSGTLVSELYTATSVELKNGTTVTLNEINGGLVEEMLPPTANGTYVIEVGVVSDEGESTYRVPVDVRGITTGEIESTTLNKREIFPPKFLTVVSTIVNDGEQDTKYNYTAQITQNGTTHVQESVNTTVVGAGDSASAGIGFQVPKSLQPGDYTVEILISSPNHTSWEPFDRTSLPITVMENKQAEVDKVDLAYKSGVIQGYVTVENDGNVKLNEGSLQFAVINAETDERMAVQDSSVGAIDVGTSRQQTVNFNFSATEDSTYYIGIRYDDGNVTDDAFTQVATAPRPSMGIVDIDGPEEVVQGENATYTIVVKNNGEVKVNSTSLVARLQTGEGNTVTNEGIVVDATYPGKTAKTEVTFDVDDPSLLGRSYVSVVGQAATGNNTTQMLPRDEGIFVSAPGFIISGDSSFSDLSPGESFTVTETFLVVGRPGAQIDVQLEYDTEKLELISGRPNQTLTSGSSSSWTFLVKEPVSGNPIRIVAESGPQSKAKDVAVASVGSTGFIGDFGGRFPDSYDELFTNTYMSAVLPGYTNTVYYLLQWLVALSMVAVVQFHDAFAELSALKQHGGSLIAATWLSGFSPEISVLLTGTFGVGLYIEHKYGLG